MNKTFVLVHGSWHGGWAWNDVVRELTTRGHRACAPTLPGHGPGADRKGITHQDCVDAVVAEIERHSREGVILGHSREGVILVGHSFGGSVIQRVTDTIPDRIKRLVFLDALVVGDNQSVVDVLPAEFAALTNDMAAASSDNTMMIPWEAWRDSFMQDAPESVARAIWEQLSPEPHQVNLDKLELKRFYSHGTPKSFIYCLQDKSLGPGFFHPGMSSRLGSFKLVEMDGGHEVMFTRPEELAHKIVEASSD